MNLPTPISPSTELTENAGAIASAATSLVLASSLGALMPAEQVQPVADIEAYLRERQPVAHYEQELALWMRVPADQAKDIVRLLKAFDLVNRYVRGELKLKVSEACRRALKIYSTWNAKTFRAKYDLWMEQQDWLLLVNRTKAGAAWQDRENGLSDRFIDFVATNYLARFGRADGKLQAILALHKHWRTGRNLKGEEQSIAGYEANWDQRNRLLLPEGWTYGNIMRQIKVREMFKRAEQALLHDSTAAATKYLPGVHRTRAGMLFMQEITFDDVRFDYLIMNEATGQPEELWALIARDTATGMVLGFVLHPASVREDGTASHLGAQQMKELAGQLLETFPLPPYQVTWKVERGTATLKAAVKAALGELFGNRIIVSYTKMLGDKSPVGYAERKKGNSAGKASHESHNRLYHTQGSYIPGQTGNHYGVRPSDLNARCEEAKQIWQDAQNLPEHLRAEVRYPLLTLVQATAKVREFSIAQNLRDQHDMEGFEQVLEWFNPVDGQIHSAESVPHPLPTGARIIKRMERPIERAMKLIRSVTNWTRCSPAVVVAFLQHSQRIVPVKINGEISFDVDGKTLTFVSGGVALPKGTTKVLVYFRATEPDFIHLTDGKGGILGTWSRKGGVRFNDRDGLAEAMRYTHAAKAAAEARAKELAAPQVDELEALRAHNAQLHQFIDTTEAPAPSAGQISSPVGDALTTVSTAINNDKKTEAKRQRTAAKHAEDARATLLDM